MNSIRILRLLLPAMLIALMLPQVVMAQDVRFVPRDEGATDAGWVRFRDRLLTAVQQRDRKFVLGVIDRNVRNGLEQPRGLDEFRRQWDTDAEDSPLWRELARALHVRETDVRSEPSGTAAIRARTGHVIVAVADWEVEDRDPGSRQKWVLVRLHDGNPGFVAEEHIRSPIEQLACFRRTEAGWRLTSFLAAGE
jgi:hypothetical protein